jgi:uncharacterized protein (DUF433 family)
MRMNLEDYFDFLAPDDIRLKGHLIGIEQVLHYYLDGCPPEKIAMHLPSVSLEKIYVTIAYYLFNQPEIDAYLTQLASRRYYKYLANPSLVAQRMRSLKKR